MIILGDEKESDKIQYLFKIKTQQSRRKLPQPNKGFPQKKPQLTYLICETECFSFKNQEQDICSYLF